MYTLLKDAAIHVEHLGGVLLHHTSRRGSVNIVSHTLKTATKLLAPLVFIFRKTDSERRFCKKLENALYQSQIGPTEITYSQNGRGRLGPRSIFIQGAFDIDQLREYLLINEPETIQLEISGPKQ